MMIGKISVCREKKGKNNDDDIINRQILVKVELLSSQKNVEDEINYGADTYGRKSVRRNDRTSALLLRGEDKCPRE